MSTLYIKDGSGKWVAVPALPGPPGALGGQGDPGYTPIRGVDYWTAEDVAAIEAASQAYIADELAKRGQLAPEFANSITECTDTAGLYVLPDGYVYAYMTTAGGANFKNLADPNSADWLTDKRLNSSHVETAAAGISVTNYLSVDGVSAFHLKGLDILSAHSSGENYGRIYVYDADKNYLGYCQPSTKTAFFSAAGYDSSVCIVDWVSAKAYWFSAYNIAYIRFGGIPSDDVIITADEEITYAESGAKVWQNTGHAFIPADYEDRITELETEVDAHTDSILSLENKMRDLESDAIAIPDYWQEAVDEAIAKIKAVQVGRNCLTFPFFSDNHQRNGYAGVLIAKVMSECNIPYCFYGGDSISSGYIASEEAMIGQDRLFDRMMKAIPNGRFCRAVGNHDGYWAVSADENHTYTHEQIYDLFLREESIAQNKHFGGDGTYYYIEDRASKVRFAVLNTNGSVDEAQLKWLEEVALKFEESGWALVFISHQPITNNFHSNIANARQVQGILTAYINGASSNKADVIGWFAGHIHRDRIYQCDHTGNVAADDTTTVDLPWKTVTITSDHTEIAYDDTTKHTVAEDDQSHAIDFVTVNRTTRTVNITRLGIGADRSYSY